MNVASAMSFVWDTKLDFPSGFSLKILSGSSLHFVGIRIFIVVYVRNAKSQFSSKQGILATQSRDWNES